MATGKPTINVLAAVVLAAAFCARAADLYVGGANGTYATIQDAVDAASAGDVIHVAAGTYATGGAVDDFKRSGTLYSMSNRVYITKSLTICGAGKDKTFIVGAHASVAEDTGGIGLGVDAVRCIGINADNVVVSNLTITGGATKVPASNDLCNGNGGGVYVQNGRTGVYVVDCVISNNIAQRGAGMRYDNDATYGATAVRCWFHNNRAINRDPATRGTVLLHCLVTHHFNGSSLIYSGTLVNCTFADNHCRAVCDASVSARNCFFADIWVKMDFAKASYDNCGVPLSESGETTSTTNTHCLFSIGYDQFVAPIRKDFRLHSGANVLNAGDMSFIAELSVPEDFKYTDFYGNGIDKTAETCHLGCCQSSVTPAGGMVRFANMPSSNTLTGSYAYTLSTDNSYTFDGIFEMPMRGELDYVRAETWPDFVKVEVETRQWTGQYGFSASGADSVWRYPYLDGTYEIALPKATGAELVLTPKKADSVFHVRQNPAAASPTGTAEAPDTDLQTAINRVGADKYGIIRCHGRNVFSTGATKYNASVITNRIGVTGRYVRIVGADGPENNFIIGAPDPTVALDSYPYGMGSGAIRCLCFTTASAIQGFTLTGGYSDSPSAAGTDNRPKRGAGAFLNAAGAQITDCVISNCVGAQGVAICGQDAKVSTGYAFRCLILDNYQWSATGTEFGGGIVRMANGGFLLMAGNNGIVSGSYEGQQLYNCSIFSSAGESGTSLNVLSTATTNYNCAIKLRGADTVKLNNTVVHGGVVSFSGGAVHSASTSWEKTDPLFAAAADGDLRLSAVSPARTYGTFDGPNALYHVFMGRDFYGNPYRVENDKPLCGAVHDFAPTVVVSGSGISPAGTNVYTSAGAAIEFTATAERPLIGFLVNGVTQEVAGVTYTYTVPEADDYSTPFSVSALYDTNWYVDDSALNDDGNGSSAHPKKTLAGALAHAVSGDVVHVAPGTYAEGSMTQNVKAFAVTTNYVVNCRACIPEGVSVVSQGSATDTFIVGADAPAASIVTNGCGKGATRCVFMNYNSSLRGFTVTGGRTDAVTGDSSDNTAGGGVLARNDTAVISDCVISNNVAQRGAGAYFGTYDRCLFLGNTVVNGGNGSATHGENGAFSSPFTVKMRNCIVAGNAGYVTVYYGALDNCTLAADNVDHNGNADQMTLLNVCPVVRNTLILGFKTTGGVIGLTNCAFTAETASLFAKNTSAVTNRCLVASSGTELQMDGFTPVIGSNIAVDAGDASLYDAAAFGDEDAYGNPRAVNGRRLDIGAVEAPWLGKYTEALGSRYAAVTSASPEVELTASGVMVPGGASLAADVHGAGRERAVSLSVAAGSTCDVSLDGAAIASFSAGEGQTLNVTPSHENAELVFSATGAETVISQFRSLVGGLLIVR